MYWVLLCHQGQIWKKADTCLNLYPCVIKYYLILSLSLSLTKVRQWCWSYKDCFLSLSQRQDSGAGPTRIAFSLCLKGKTVALVLQGLLSLSVSKARQWCWSYKDCFLSLSQSQDSGAGPTRCFSSFFLFLFSFSSLCLSGKIVVLVLQGLLSLSVSKARQWCWSYKDCFLSLSRRQDSGAGPTGIAFSLCLKGKTVALVLQGLLSLSVSKARQWRWSYKDCFLSLSQRQDSGAGPTRCFSSFFLLFFFFFFFSLSLRQDSGAGPTRIAFSLCLKGKTVALVLQGLLSLPVSKARQWR